MRDAGVSLLFLSGNAVCWVTPYRDEPRRPPEPDHVPRRPLRRPRTITPGSARRQHGPFPERGPDEGLLMGARNVEPVNGGGDWVVRQARPLDLRGDGREEGRPHPRPRRLGVPRRPGRDIPGLEVVAAGTAWVGGVTPQQWAATVYPGPKGNVVFNASTIFWAQGLSSPPGHTLPWSHWSRPHGPDDRVQRITHNVLRRAIEGGA